MTTPVRERLVLTGLSPRELRERARCRFDAKFGPGCWRLCSEDAKPCLVSLGGRVRLYECKFEAVADGFPDEPSS